ncbi:MAG: hypothetical protein IKT00_08915 [Prevotella sp.]|nr:hypothetical protein [Prevotella sp.]
MKKLFYSMLAIATMAFALSSCEDVPAPYDDPNINHNSGKTVDENEIISETFASNFGQFEVVTPKGIAWVINYSTATGTGYNSKDKTNTESESYLISPEIDLSEVNEAYLTFLYIFRYKNNAGEDKVLITDEYTGDPTTTNWDDMTGTLTEGTDWDTFYSFDQNIPEKFLGKKAVRIALYYSGTDKSSRTWEVKNLKVMKGKAPEGNTPEMPTDLTGAGTKENPYTVADANKIIASLGNSTSDEVFIKGKVSKIDEVDASYGNATYYMSDDGSENGQLYVYRGSYLGGDKFKATSAFNVGDDIIICGQLVNFKGNTPEVTQGSWIYSLNGTVKDKTDPTAVNGTPEGDGSQGSPYNVAGALTYIKTLGDATSDNKYVKGIVTSITEVNIPNGNATFYISDDAAGTDKLLIYRAKNLNNTNYTAENEIAVGDEVVVYGPLVNYRGNTPEMTQGGYIVSTTHQGPNYGTYDNPLSITEAKALVTADAAWVTGEVVGFVEGDDFASGYTYFASAGQTSVNTNIIIDMGGNYTGVDFSMPVQLPRSFRSALSLANNPNVLGCKLVIYGQIGSYLNATGILSPTFVEVYDASGAVINTIGTRPD